MNAGDRCAYRAYAGDVYDALIAKVHPDSRVDLVIDIPGRKDKDPFIIRAIRWYDDPSELLPGARPRKPA